MIQITVHPSSDKITEGGLCSECGGHVDFEVYRGIASVNVIAVCDECGDLGETDVPYAAFDGEGED